MLRLRGRQRSMTFHFGAFLHKSSFSMPNTVSFNENYPDITKSDALYARAQKIMTPVTQTLAKGPGQYTKGRLA